jgi:multidrug resistance efflux pump
MKTLEAEMPPTLMMPLPARRPELVLRAVGGPGNYVAKEPCSGAYFQLGEEEHFLLQQLDGRHSADAVSAAFAQRFGQPLSPAELDEFVEMARSRGFLEDGARTFLSAASVDSSPGPGNGQVAPTFGGRCGQECPRSGSVQQRPEPAAGSGPVPTLRQRQSVLYWRKRLFDPDRLFSRLAPKLWFFWTPGFAAFSAGCIAVASLVFWLNRHEVAASIAHALNLNTALLAWLAMIVVTTFHESAHGLTCKRYGGEVHEIGFLLIYLQPAFYCNVSDAWLIPEKSKRLWVTFAGAWFELFIWALATFVWRVTDTDVWLNHLALVVMAASGIATLFNFNPLIKLDGYYLLSDYLEIPNLRRRAFLYLGDCVRRLRGSAPLFLPEPSPREKRIYLRYGLLAWTYSTLLLGVTLVYLAERLTGRYQAWGLVLFVGLVGLMFQAPLRRLFRRLAARCSPARGPQPGLLGPEFQTALINTGLQPGDQRWGDPPAVSTAFSGEASSSETASSDHRPFRTGSVPAAQPTIAQRFNAGDSRARQTSPEGTAENGGAFDGPSSGTSAHHRPARRWMRRLAWLALSGSLLTATFLFKMELRVSGPFTILPLRNAEVRPEVEGIIQEIFVEEGDRLNQGQPVVRLSDRDYRAELQKTRAQIEEQGARLRLLKAGSRPQEIEVARTLVAKAEERLKYAKSRQVMDTKLYDDKLLSLRELQQSQEAVAVSADELHEAQGRLDLLLAGSRLEDIEAVQAEIGRLRAQEQLLEDQLKRLLVLSPIPGVVTTHRLKEKLGQNVRKGDLIATVQELDTVTAELAIPEKEIADVKVGQQVVLKARAYPEKSFTGTISAIAPIANREANLQGQKVFLVTTQIRNESHLLTSEMTGNARIYCGQRRIVELLTRRLTHYLRVEVWSWW